MALLLVPARAIALTLLRAPKRQTILLEANQKAASRPGDDSLSRPLITTFLHSKSLQQEPCFLSYLTGRGRKRQSALSASRIRVAGRLPAPPEALSPTCTSSSTTSDSESDKYRSTTTSTTVVVVLYVTVQVHAHKSKVQVTPEY